MANLDILRKNLEERGFSVSRFQTAQQAADYLDSQVDNVTVGFGGSVTVQELGLYQRLASHNKAIWHWENGSLPQAASADVYITSANGVAETGEIVNIDGSCNRVSASLYGHKKVYFIIGSNKVAPDYEGALWRARNIAAPKNAQRLGKKTPCAVNADKCYDCHSPERICRALVVLWEKPTAHGQEVEVVLVDEPLGF